MGKFTPLRQRAITAIRRPGECLVPNRRWGPVIEPDSVSGGTPNGNFFDLTGPNQTITISYPTLIETATYRFTLTRFDRLVGSNDPCGDPEEFDAILGSVDWAEPGDISILTGRGENIPGVVITTNACAPVDKVFTFGEFKLRRIL